MTIGGDGNIEYRKFFPSQRQYVRDNVTYTLEPDMVFNEGHLVLIIFYSILFVISAVGNITVLVLLLRRKAKIRSRVNFMLVHLTIADLLVTFILMPLEIVWATTVSWWAGDITCRVMQFFRTFGLYQSSFVLVCIAIDRYNAVLKPLMLTAAEKTGRTLIKLSWLTAAICSIPQAVVFKVHPHPNHTWYEQCISINSLNPGTHELVTYSVLNMLIMYVFPLIAIIYCYGSIVREICQQANGTAGDKLRRSTKEFLGKAKTRTFRMTVTLILAFFTCWTPYYFITLWYNIDRQSAAKLDNKVQKGLFIFACTNSCINPMVYGIFNIRRNKTKRTRTRESNNTCTTEVRMNQLNGKKFDPLRRDSERFMSVRRDSDLMKRRESDLLRKDSDLAIKRETSLVNRDSDPMKRRDSDLLRRNDSDLMKTRAPDLLRKDSGLVLKRETNLVKRDSEQLMRRDSDLMTRNDSDLTK
uniref:G-protein coupled receptors family 1 profile domain-containing protein n=2 Tax=Lygus hesperus TaxID=30085 RepID=A0A0K8SPD4_LYGHE